ncbi:hypothetical protein EVAR_95796_1 [Eumeta japonica]|uniref:Uncharacterized protein n=1 Tax=Eumeta variegata TaxID=151549 RepID=A0A4C1W4W2_EUMVA|nr:hypothetical protein EVAR_95796_1 [Eumeta japonica]
MMMTSATARYMQVASGSAGRGYMGGPFSCDAGTRSNLGVGPAAEGGRRQSIRFAHAFRGPGGLLTAFPRSRLFIKWEEHAVGWSEREEPAYRCRTRERKGRQTDWRRNALRYEAVYPPIKSYHFKI